MNPDQESWGPCPEGELESMVGRLRAQRRNFVINRVAAVSATVFMALVVVGVAAPFVRDQWLVEPKDPNVVQPIACGEVREHLPLYAQHKLDPELTERIDKHLEGCRNCRRQLATTPGTAATPISGDVLIAASR